MKSESNGLKNETINKKSANRFNEKYFDFLNEKNY